MYYYRLNYSAVYKVVKINTTFTSYNVSEAYVLYYCINNYCTII